MNLFVVYIADMIPLYLVNEHGVVIQRLHERLGTWNVGDTLDGRAYAYVAPVSTFKQQLKELL